MCISLGETITLGQTITFNASCRQQLRGNLHPQLVCANGLPRLMHGMSNRIACDVTHGHGDFTFPTTTSKYPTADTQNCPAAISAGLQGASSAAAGDLTVATGTQHLPLEIGGGKKIGGSAAVTGVLVLLSLLRVQG